MFKHRKSRLFIVLIPLLLVLILSLMVAIVSAKVKDEQFTVTAVSSSGIVTFNTGFAFAGTEVGGLSGITYDANRGVYYAISDDRSQTNDARFYTVAIDVSDGQLDDGDVQFLDVTTLLDENREPFAPRSVDPEGITMASPGRILISSEGDANSNPVIDPFLNRFNPLGKQNKVLPVPDKFLPDGLETFGVRDNLEFESLSTSPDRQALFTATENALAQDGPASGIGVESLSRILQYQTARGRPGTEYVYVTGAIPVPPVPPGAFADNGLVELAGLDNTGTLLAMERSFAVGVGNTIQIFEILTQDATDVSGIDDLYDESTGTPAAFDPVEKRLIANLEDLGIDPDNVERMTFGPVLPDGSRSLILVSDNNFNPAQITQFILLSLEIESDS